MNLAIDIGNSFIKAGIFDGEEMIQSYHFLKEGDVEGLIERFRPRHVIISSVSGKEERFVTLAERLAGVLVLKPGLKLPVVNKYKTPETLGADRLAAAAGAAVLYPGSDTLVIDSGTCITYEFINEKNEYLGGAISPGIEMRLKALHTFTGKLPLIDRANNPVLTGGNTQECIRSGVLNGVVAEVEGIIAQYRQAFPGLKVILCGGDTSFFESKIKETIFAVPDLVLIGLNSILLQNVSEH